MKSRDLKKPEKIAKKLEKMLKEIEAKEAKLKKQ